MLFMSCCIIPNQKSQIFNFAFYIYLTTQLLEGGCCNGEKREWSKKGNEGREWV